MLTDRLPDLQGFWAACLHFVQVFVSVNPFSSTTSLLHRIAAIAAILVSCLGKTLHLHQECDGCCSAEVCYVETSRSHSACPYGCKSCTLETASGPSESDESPKPVHDEHQCSICQVLAQSPEIATILQAPELTDWLRIEVEIRPSQPQTKVALAVSPRGPPATGFGPVA